MAAVATVEQTYSLGGTDYLYRGTIAFDNNYPTGGEAIDVGSNETISYLSAPPSAGYLFEWDRANQKLKVYWGNAGTASVLPEFTSTGDLSALTAVPFIAIGQ